MQIVKVTTYGRDSKGNISGKKDTYFGDRITAWDFARSDGRVHGDYGAGGSDILRGHIGHYWSDARKNVFAQFDETESTGEEIVFHAEISFCELI